MEPIKIEDAEVKKAIHSGNQNIQVGTKKYFLIEVEETNHYSSYVVTDPEEEKQLRDALDKKIQFLQKLKSIRC